MSHAQATEQEDGRRAGQRGGDGHGRGAGLGGRAPISTPNAAPAWKPHKRPPGKNIAKDPERGKVKFLPVSMEMKVPRQAEGSRRQRQRQGERQ
ncbi:hypothetical protein [Streptomyces albogriseolus]